MASSAAYRHRFGSLARAYQLIEYTPDRDFAYIETNRRLRQLHPEIVARVIRALEDQGGNVTRDPRTDLLHINGMLAVSVVIAPCKVTSADAYRWSVRLDAGLEPDLAIVVRMDAPNRDPLDYYILPMLDIRAARLRIKEDNGIFLDGYRYASLDYFLGIAQTVRVGGAA